MQQRMRMAEPWLRGPIPGMPAMVMPAAHALMQAAEDIPRAVAGLTAAQLWALPGGAAAVGWGMGADSRHATGRVCNRVGVVGAGDDGPKFR